MKTASLSDLFWIFIVAAVSVAVASSAPSQFSKTLEDGAISLLLTKGAQGSALLSEEPNDFPFRIEGNRFVRKSDGKPIFLNIIGYQPLEPGKKPWDENYPERELINDYRLKDDLRRLKAFQGASEPIVLRVYPQPTPRIPNRLPKFFYERVRELGFWIIRDIYFDNINIVEGKDKVDMVFSEVNDVNAFDIIFAWEIGKEFKAPEDGSAFAIESFIEEMCVYIKQEVNELNVENASNWVTWQSWVMADPLRTDFGTIPIEPEDLDYISFNVYSYEPEQMRDHQPGPVTGTPYQGYLKALKEHYSEKPLVITETGLSDSNLVEPDTEHIHERLQTWYPSYRKGALTAEQVAEGLAARYWDARLLRDANDPNIVIAGLATFEWNDEWWKKGGDWEPEVDNQLPEEHFGLGRFERKMGEEGYQLKYKLQQETVRYLYTLKFDNDANIIESLTAEANSLAIDANIWVYAVISDSAVKPVRLRWETNRGYIIGEANGECGLNGLGEPNRVKFYAGNVALGPALITLVAIDANGNVDTASTCINIWTSEPNHIDILTFGAGLQTGRASGRVYNVNLDKYKLVCYLLEKWRDPNMLVAKPYFDMKSIWINKKGYWWTRVQSNPDDDLYCWLVPREYETNDLEEADWSPSCAIAGANTVDKEPNDYNDIDKDLLPDYWEVEHFGNIESNDRYDDPDKDVGNNLEEFHRGLDPNNYNDDDADGLRDNWEYHFFGCPNFFDANDDPDCDGLKNWQEQDPNVSTHPARASQDRDRDGLPDVWELRKFGYLGENSEGNPDLDACKNIDEYELGLDPVSRDFPGDFDCDCDVDLRDLRLFLEEWPGIGSPANIAPESPDRIVNFLDWAVFADAWKATSTSQNWDPNCDIFPDEGDDKIDWFDVAVFTEQWLRYYYADIAPDGGDGIVDFRDFAALAENWLRQLE